MTLAALTTYVLVILWPTGEVTRENATTLATCQTAAIAAERGVGLPLGRSTPAREAHCEQPRPGEGFAPGWNCIVGFGCDG
jgi:hypothetical protein